MVLEQTIVNGIRSYLLGQGRTDTWCLKVVDVPQGFPDLIGAWYGMPFAVEVKAPGKEARPEQTLWINRLGQSGYASGVAHDVDEFVALMETPR